MHKTRIGGVYGGMGSGTESFQMKLDRPFLFLIHDLTTGALLFAGAVLEPMQM